MNESRLPANCAASRCSPGLTDEQLEWLAGHGEVLQFEPGEMVFREGDPADSMFVDPRGLRSTC